MVGNEFKRWRRVFDGDSSIPVLFSSNTPTLIAESMESRFAHLLQPIRELTKNWEVDVASELNDYLEELDDMCITFDGGKTRLNFAEAALLIQGSACIYSKKVELLHSLVYQTLEYFSDRNKKRNKDAAAASAQGGDAGGAMSSHDADDVGVFTPLDLEVSENSQKSDSSVKVNVTPLPPESLIPLESHEKHKLPLISLKGEVVCSQKDFRINRFVPGEEDLILLRRWSSAMGRMQLDVGCPEDAGIQLQTGVNHRLHLIVLFLLVSLLQCWMFVLQ
ncbi:condensin-2 complex subunit H2 [Xenentodon cancila]